MLRKMYLLWFSSCVLFVPLGCSQDSSQPTAPASSPNPTATSGSLGSSTVTINTPKPPEEPYLLEGGGFSIEPIYWLNRSQIGLFGGATATSYGNYGFAGNAKYSPGGELSIPAGRSNSLRFSYFRSQGNGNATLGQDATLFSEAYNTGDYLNASYTMQSAKVSWDYLSYSWHKKRGALRLKTLWEVQLVNADFNSIAPFKPVTTDSSTGNTDDNIAHGSKNLVLPTLGLELEQAMGHYFRWEVKGSGFGLPHRSDIWDAEGTLVCRLGQFELLAGEKGYHFKMSPKAEEYFANTMSGVYVAIRYYWSARE
jgi:hypothetical protein